ncbi:hypothetical protein LA080_003441 [Diaporthe eres]|nr:hypothetical protein LA080_003441 [Diaporthe eres]
MALTVRSERGHACGLSDPIEKGTRGDATSKSHPDQHLRSEILAASPIHMILNDMVRRAAVSDGHGQATAQFILDTYQRIWSFGHEDGLDSIRSVAWASSHDRRPLSTPAASTEAGFAASCFSVGGGPDRLGSDEPDSGETASVGIYVCHANDAARASSRDHTEN